MSRKVLGRGLDALIPRPPAEMHEVATAATVPRVERGMVPVERIRPNPWQPRSVSDPVKMDELVRSIQSLGVLEPLLLRARGESYELVAGERRLRAAQRIGMNEVPAIIVDLGDKESLEVALVENIQREDLNPVDEARAYHVLAEEFGRTHDEIAIQVGKDRSTVSNLLRLLRLPVEVLDAVSGGTLSVGHARSLLSFSRSQDQQKWASRILEQEWSVRETERRIAHALAPKSPGASDEVEDERDPHQLRVEDAIRRRVGTEVHLRVGRKGSGRLELVFSDQEVLERILDILGVQIH
jgi:ParB family transcriptional regulator, chromosome partitioning protein